MKRCLIAGQRLRCVRKTLGYKLRELARSWETYNKTEGLKKGEGLPVTHAAISSWEKMGIPLQGRKMDQDKPLSLVANYFNLPPDFFMDESENDTQEELQDKIKRAMRKKKGGIMTVLSEIVDSISPRSLEKAFRLYEGYYWAYFYWISLDQENGKLKNWIYKPLIRVATLDKKLNVIKAQFISHRLPTLEGIMIPKPGKLFFIFETSADSLDEEMSYVFIITRNKPKNYLQGLLLAESTQPPEKAVRFEVLPASSRILLKKIEEADVKEEDLKLELRPYKAEEIEKNILDQISNKVDYEFKVLQAFEIEK